MVTRGVAAVAEKMNRLSANGHQRPWRRLLERNATPERNSPRAAACSRRRGGEKPSTLRRADLPQATAGGGIGRAGDHKSKSKSIPLASPRTSGTGSAAMAFIHCWIAGCLE